MTMVMALAIPPTKPPNNDTLDFCKNNRKVKIEMVAMTTETIKVVMGK